MSEVSETPLPGVGVRHEFTTDEGERLAVITHRTGRRELAVYSGDDPDACVTVLHLSPQDSRTLGELLGGSSIAERVAAVQQQLEGLTIDWVTLTPNAPSVGTTIGEGELRSRSGASIVAIVRAAVTIAAPGPEHRFESGDVVVAVGPPDRLAALRVLLVS